MSEIYVSCGAFISKLNGRDYKLLQKWADKFECDGFEFMMYPDFYDCLGDVVDCCQGFRIPVFHADKVIGDRVSDPEPQSFDRAKELRRNAALCNVPMYSETGRCRSQAKRIRPRGIKEEQIMSPMTFPCNEACDSNKYSVMKQT